MKTTIAGSQSQNAKRVLVLSLYPLTALGGGERYTYETIKSISNSGDDCDAYALKEGIGDRRHSVQERLGSTFSKVVDHGEFLSERPDSPLSYILDEMATYDVVWVEQFLSTDIVFDVIASVASDQTLLFTNLGHEPLKNEFASCYQPAASHWFVEISDFAAKRSKGFSENTIGVSASLWLSDLNCRDKSYDFRHRVVSIGRVMPHKGFEHTIRALPPDCELRIVGPHAIDDQYFEYLRRDSLDRRVQFLGAVSDEEKSSAIWESDLLVASSCHNLYDGRRIEQAELLGIVLFEALASGTVPVSSNIGPFVEVMSNLGLNEFVYREGDSSDLALRIANYRRMRSEYIRDKVSHATNIIKRQYLWDDYWTRVKTAIRLV
ncbi:MAG: glycosyltransferase family 4 protein [Ignavibacteriota bacterium]